MPDRDKEYKIGDVKMDNGARRRGPGPRFAEKPKNFRGTLGKLLRYLGRYRFLLLVALLLAAGNNILTLVGPGRLAEMTRLMTEGLKSGGIDVAAVTRVATALAGLYGISFLFGVLQGELRHAPLMVVAQHQDGTAGSLHPQAAPVPGQRAAPGHLFQIDSPSSAVPVSFFRASWKVVKPRSSPFST